MLGLKYTELSPRSCAVMPIRVLTLQHTKILILTNTDFASDKDLSVDSLNDCKR